MATSVTGKATEFIQFSRASNATVTDSDGKVKWAPHNLLTNSESFDNAAWTSTNLTVSANSTAAPNGTSTADKVVETAVNNVHTINQQITLGAAGNYTFGVYLKAAERTRATVYAVTITSGTSFNLSTGVKVADVDTPPIASSITSVGNGWYLCTITVACAAVSNGFRVYVENDAGSILYLGDITKGIFAWGAHLYRSDLGGMQANTSAYPMYNPTTPKNLLGSTEAFDVSPWSNTGTGGTGVNPVVTANAGLAPNGLQTADRIQFSLAGGTSTSDISRRIQQFSTVSGTPYTFSMWVKSYDGNPYTMHLVGAGGLTSNIVAVTNEWQRVSVTANGFGGNVSFAIGLRGGQTPTNSNTADVLVWGAQLSDSASLDPYVPDYDAAVTSAAYYGPRRDFDSAGVCKGLLVEEQRTNLLLYSADFTQAAWTKFNLNTSGTPAWSNVAVAPDGTQTAEKLIANTTNSAHWVGGSATITNGVAYTVSAYVKSGADAGDYTFASLYDCNASTYIIVNLSTGALVSATATTYTITSVGSGWYRLSVTATSSSTTGYNRVYLYDGTTTNFAGNDAKGIYAWGLQLEAGSFATSYIPTGAATATRSADVASVSTQAFPYSSTEGTWVANFQTIFDTITPVASCILTADGSASKLISYIGSGASQVSSYDGSTIITRAIDVTGPVSKAASAYNASGRALAVNGSAVATGTIAAGYSTVSTANLGGTTSIGLLNGWLRQVTYLPRRISDAELTTRSA